MNTKIKTYATFFLTLSLSCQSSLKCVDITIKNVGSKKLFGKIVLIYIEKTTPASKPEEINLPIVPGMFADGIIAQTVGKIAQQRPIIEIPFKALPKNNINLKISSYDLLHLYFSDSTNFDSRIPLKGSRIYFVPIIDEDKKPLDNRTVTIAINSDDVTIDNNGQEKKFNYHATDFPTATIIYAE